MKKSLQTIEDFYVQRGIKGEKLRNTLKNDVEYQKLFSERKAKLRKRFSVSKKDQRRYVLPTDEDYKILEKIYRLEKVKLATEDRRIVRLIRTQLEYDWRKSLMRTLDKLLKTCE